MFFFLFFFYKSVLKALKPKPFSTWLPWGLTFPCFFLPGTDQAIQFHSFHLKKKFIMENYICIQKYTATRVPWQLTRLRIWHGHCYSFNHVGRKKRGGATHPIGAWGKNPLFTSCRFWWLWPPSSCGHIMSSSVTVVTLPSLSQISHRLSLIRTFVIGFRVYIHNPGWSHLKILKLLTSAKTVFPNKQPRF